MVEVFDEEVGVLILFDERIPSRDFVRGCVPYERLVDVDPSIDVVDGIDDDDV